jgi:sialate O-acetylesterase
MVRNWRNLFKQGELPFYYVQVAPYTWQENNPEAFEYAELREAQSRLRMSVPGTGMAVTMDIADPNDIHPRNKQDVGYRLARLALAHTYGMSDMISSGPEYESISAQKDTLIVSFMKESIGSGLATNDGQTPRHFFIAGADKKFYPAEAVIKENQVWLFSKQVKKPVAVRYAFTNYPVTNFCNQEGFPAIPFRSSF